MALGEPLAESQAESAGLGGQVDGGLRWFASRRGRADHKQQLPVAAAPLGAFLLAALAARGFVVRLFENVLFREVAAGGVEDLEGRAPAGCGGGRRRASGRRHPRPPRPTPPAAGPLP